MPLRVEHTVELGSPLAATFRWYTDLENVRRMTPPELHLRITRAETPLRGGSRVLFSIRPKFVPFEITWLLQIDQFVENQIFSERLLKGPFDHWVHTHTFESLPGGRCRVHDVIEWDNPSVLLRAVASDSYIRGKLMETFEYREGIMRSALETPGTDPGH